MVIATEDDGESWGALTLDDPIMTLTFTTTLRTRLIERTQEKE
jgi:hypothetical protein